MLMQDFSRFAALADAVTALPIAGLTAGTLVETGTGWCRAETLQRGDLIHTLDGGLRPVLALHRAWLMPGAGGHVMHLPGGALGNDDDVTLLPGQHLLVDLPLDQAGRGGLPDALAVLVPAVALDRLPGAGRRAILRPVEVVTPLFADEEYVWAASGLLLRCPSVVQGAGAAPDPDGLYPPVDNQAARRLIDNRLMAA